MRKMQPMVEKELAKIIREKGERQCVLGSVRLFVVGMVKLFTGG